MVRNGYKWAILSALITGMFSSGNVLAAEITDVLDAADQVYLDDELVDDVFDIALSPSFKQRHEWAKLKREYADPDTKKTRLLNELEYERVINRFDIDLEIGLFHDLSFRMNLPIIISDQQSYKFDTSSDDPLYQITKGGTPTPDGQLMGISWFSPKTTDETHPYRFFELDDGEVLKGNDRSGLGDMSFGIAWSPYNTERNYIPDRPWKDETGRSTFTLAFDYVAPTGKARAIDNSDPGSGVHEFQFSVAASHRFAFIDPYIGLKLGVPVGTDAFKDYGANQIRKDPGLWGQIDLGIEFVPYEALHKDYQRFVKIDLRGYFKYTGEGRTYSELMDAFGQGTYYVNNASSDIYTTENGWLAEKWSNAGSNRTDLADRKFEGIDLMEDGMFDYEGYATLGGSLNLYIQPIQYVRINAGVAVDYAQNHFITFTKIGKDRVTYNEKDGTTSKGKDGYVTDSLVEERNPTFSGSLDRVGSRIKRTESLNLEWFVGLSLMY